MLLKATVLWPIKSRPIGSWSHTWKRTKAICGICILKTRVSSHIGLKPEWQRKGKLKRFKRTTAHERWSLPIIHVPLSSTTLVCCLEQSTGKPMISTSTKGSIIWKCESMKQSTGLVIAIFCVFLMISNDYVNIFWLHLSSVPKHGVFRFGKLLSTDDL